MTLQPLHFYDSMAQSIPVSGCYGFFLPLFYFRHKSIWSCSVVVISFGASPSSLALCQMKQRSAGHGCKMCGAERWLISYSRRHFVLGQNLFTYEQAESTLERHNNSGLATGGSTSSAGCLIRACCGGLLAGRCGIIPKQRCSLGFCRLAEEQLCHPPAFILQNWQCQPTAW